MAYGGFPRPEGVGQGGEEDLYPGQDYLEEDFISLHPPDIVVNRRDQQYLNNVQPESLATREQTSHVRNNSDSSGCHSPTAELSPYGSPGREKHEELVMNNDNCPRNCTSGRRRGRQASTADYSTYEGRLQTFRRWPVTFLSGEVLAEAGLYFLGLEDEVCCYECRGTLKGWQIGDDPRNEHFNQFGRRCFPVE